jgi:NADH:ubiquinone oxidoreductase subunit H
MQDLKLVFFFFNETGLETCLNQFLDFFNYFTYVSNFSSTPIEYAAHAPSAKIAASAIKFVFAIAFLILIRGGTPRYRYDYLTKLG